jgi:hypothetical protein
MLCLRFLIVYLFPLTVEAEALDTIPPLLNIANVPPQLTVLSFLFLLEERDIINGHYSGSHSQTN